jgi:DNA-binding CsgD family transcriptional regulator
MENQLRPVDADALSKRERDVVLLAALGRQNKVIAYELGLAYSTVTTLLARAAKKLGARSRTELLAQATISENEAPSPTSAREKIEKKGSNRKAMGTRTTRSL